MASPYDSLPPNAFWRTGVAECQPTELENIYIKKWNLTPDLKVATAGSCFAQHISRYLVQNGFSVMDVEPPPADMLANHYGKYGYGLYSARYGNIYTVHQLLQLAKEVIGIFKPSDAIWERDGRFYDALRPSVEPVGFETSELVNESREHHLRKVREMFLGMDLFVFTLGLTEAWIHRQSGTVFPTAPETIAGIFDDSIYELKNYQFEEIHQAFNEFQEIVRSLRGNSGFKILLTVSPVPLTATASRMHVLQASTYSKSVLRAVAGQLANNQSHIDYFPSFEIITNPSARTTFYESNLRSVKAEGVQAVMQVFFRQHNKIAVDRSDFSNEINKLFTQPTKSDSSMLLEVNDDLQCEEALLNVFNHETNQKINTTGKKLIVFIGDSHLAGVKDCVEKYFLDEKGGYEFSFIPVNWMVGQWDRFSENGHLTSLKLKDKYLHLIEKVPSSDEMRSGATLCLVGLGMLGDGIVRAHGSLLSGSPDLSNGRNISPNIPIITPVKDVFEISDDVNLLKKFARAAKQWWPCRRRSKYYENYINFYTIHFADKKNIYLSLRESGIYNKIFWVAAPNMVEDVARFRFGDEYVESRSHALHSSIALNCFLDSRIDTNENGWLITHSQKYETLDGFTQNKYAASKARYDIHVNGEFYRAAIQQFFDNI